MNDASAISVMPNTYGHETSAEYIPGSSQMDTAYNILFNPSQQMPPPPQSTCVDSNAYQPRTYFSRQFHDQQQMPPQQSTYDHPNAYEPRTFFSQQFEGEQQPPPPHHHY